MMNRRTLFGAFAAMPLARPALAQAPAPLVMAVSGGGGALVWRESFVPAFTAGSAATFGVGDIVWN
jgi:hypothetical protein